MITENSNPLFIKSNQIKSNLFASTKYKRKTVEKHKVNTKKINDIQTMNASRTQMQRDCSYMSPKNKHKHNNDNVYRI